MIGSKFTWSNNHEDPTLETLDRYLISKDWEDQFPDVFVFKLPRELYDHNPLMLSTQRATQPKKLSFKFELSWIKDPDFLPTVKIIWDKPCHATSALDRIQSKLKHFKQYFKGWGYNRQEAQKKEEEGFTRGITIFRNSGRKLFPNHGTSYKKNYSTH